MWAICAIGLIGLVVLYPTPQKDMLEDHKRTGAYYNAVMMNRRQFEGKVTFTMECWGLMMTMMMTTTERIAHIQVVLDVGTGSGILAIFAAKAGAKKVYAVEATDMAKYAKMLVTHHKVYTEGIAVGVTTPADNNHVMHCFCAYSITYPCSCVPSN